MPEIGTKKIIEKEKYKFLKPKLVRVVLIKVNLRCKILGKRHRLGQSEKLVSNQKLKIILDDINNKKNSIYSPDNNFLHMSNLSGIKTV